MRVTSFYEGQILQFFLHLSIGHDLTPGRNVHPTQMGCVGQTSHVCNQLRPEKEGLF